MRAPLHPIPAARAMWRERVVFALHAAQYLSNGDDGYCLAFGSEMAYDLIDCIGDYEGDPGAGWDVCGVAGATKDHTLVRKGTVIAGNPDWSVTSSVEGCEFDVYEQDTWAFLGFHTVASPGDASPPSPPVTSAPSPKPSPPLPSLPPLAPLPPSAPAAPLFFSEYAEVRLRVAVGRMRTRPPPLRMRHPPLRIAPPAHAPP